jgi:AcrR family transcriptional regulator
MASPRRVGKETSETRHRILDAAEALMVASGHASVTYRAVARQAELTPSLLQYYFPSLDELLVGTVRRRSEQSLRHLVKMLQRRPDEPHRVIWDFSNDETNTALTIEFSALGNHRESIRREITEHTNRIRAIQLEALRPADGAEASLPPAAALFLLSGIPKMLRMEKDFGIHVGHEEVVEIVDRYLNDLSPSCPDSPGDRRKR